MAVDEDYREVDFRKYCATCIHLTKDEDEEPCETCLEHPLNMYTDKPVKWVEDPKKTKKKGSK